ncbi:MAG TPA: recombinase family protein [Steroidobacteraceae bacterium]|jgi:DNA invertase Pin-like site-specific DNA recombinase
MRTKQPALAYLRTSSKANVGPDKDSDKRQLAAIEGYARRNGFEIVQPPTYDAAVSGADPIDTRPGFRSMMAYVAEHAGCRTILVETASRFARDLAVQLAGHDMLKARGIAIIPVDSPDYFIEETPTAVLVRQVLGAISQFEKSMLVLKLRAARDRKRTKGRKVEGRKSHLERTPTVVKLAKELRWASKRMSEKRSLRDVSAELAKAGHVSRSGRPYSASAIASMLDS